jgi:hypothetical protein
MKRVTALLTFYENVRHRNITPDPFTLRSLILN